METGKVNSKRWEARRSQSAGSDDMKSLRTAGVAQTRGRLRACWRLARTVLLFRGLGKPQVDRAGQVELASPYGGSIEEVNKKAVTTKNTKVAQRKRTGFPSWSFWRRR